MKRFKINARKSRKSFTRNAGTHPRNNLANPMRGGYRL